MTQQNSMVNLYIQDVNGQSQMIKVVQGTNKGFSQAVKNNIPGKTVQSVFKTTTNQEGGQSMVATQPQFFTLKGGKIISYINVPQNGQLYPKLRLGSTVQGVKFVAASSTQKIIQHHNQLTQQPQQQQQSQQSQQQSPQQRQPQQTSPQVQQPATIVTGTNIKSTYISPILDHTGSRKRNDNDSDYNQPDKRRRTEKVGKGLRHFSMKVCEKVRKKGTTSYNEVADELVAEFTKTSALNNTTVEQYDQKNIRRRVYDALNVLMAMNIISKEKKEIRWLGLPTNSLQECILLEKEKQKKIDSIKQKTQKLRDLIYQQISFKNLVERNREYQKRYGEPKMNSTIQLPFIIVNTDKKTSVVCSISNDKMEYGFEFDNMFEINDDIEVLKRIGMLMGLDKGQISDENIEKAKSMLPKSLEKYVEQLARGIEEPSIDDILASAGPKPSCSKLDSYAINYVDVALGGDGDTSRQSSFSDPLSPTTVQDFTDDDQESDDLSSDIEVSEMN